MSSSSPHVSRFEPRPGEALAGGVGTALLFVLFGPFVSPVPLMILRMRTGLGPTLAGAALAAAVVAGVAGPADVVAFFLALVPSLVVADTLARGRGLVRGCVRGFVLLALPMLVALAFDGATLRDGLVATITRSAETASTWQMQPEDLEELKATAQAWTAVVSVIYPALALMTAALVILTNAMLLRFYLVRRDPGWLDGNEFESLRLPFATSLLFVLSGAAVLVEPARPVAYNVLALLTFFFALQGLAIVAFYVSRLAGPRFLRWAMVILVLGNPWRVQILALLGMLDLWFDFRKWAEPPPPAA